MIDILTSGQVADLAAIAQICEELGAHLVVIGATSLLLLMGDIGRFTRDIDLTVALDFDQFERLTLRLSALGWTRAPKLEHRWNTPRQTMIDLLPAGATLRREGTITWPESQFQMSLAGFENVFTNSVAVQLPGGVNIHVAPPAVTALLKIIAYMEDPYRRAKDLQDIRLILRSYEEKTDRIFSDAVFAAELPDFEFVNAFLLGLDLRALLAGAPAADDTRFVDRFLAKFLQQDEDGYFDGESDFGAKSFRGQIHAFRKGYTGK